MTDRIRIFVGDEILATAHYMKWAKDLNCDNLTAITGKDDLEDILSPMFFGGKTMFVWKNPNKDEIISLEDIYQYIPNDKYLCILIKSVDKRLNIFKVLQKNIYDISYILYSDKAKCIQLIKNLSGFSEKICNEIYLALGPKEIDLPNRNGNKVPTAVLNTDKLINEIEKLKLYPSIDSICIDKIISKGYFSNSWSLVDSILSNDVNSAIQQINYLVTDMNEFLMMLGLIVSEAKIGLLVATSKVRTPQAILASLAKTRNNEYIFDSENTDEKKSKLEVHPYRIIKMSQKVTPDFADRCMNMIKICQKYNGLSRSDIPISFLINAFILEITN